MKAKLPVLLLVDDDEEIRSQMKWALAQDYEVLEAEDRPSAVRRFQEQRPPVVLLDLGLPPHTGTPEEGLAALDEILAANPLAKVIIASGQSDKTNALQAVGRGAYDFLCKPVDPTELGVILRRAFYLAGLEREHHQMRQQLDLGGVDGMTGVSPCMQEVFTAIRKVASADVPVLVLGESGTGKELAGQALHRCSQRAAGPFVAINCGAIPENLLESELFGHEKGAFTGAHAQRKGRIEGASGGTLFLDEIGELPLGLQVKLLRFLQEQTIERVGGRTSILVDCRVVAATNTDLKKAMGEGRFREDLYYRLAVVVLHLPSLRERGEDVLLIARQILQRQAAAAGKPKLDFSPDAVPALRLHPWPGNVRELENRIKRAVIMADGQAVTAADLELVSGGQPVALRSLKEAREATERQLIELALRRHNGKISAAATELGISRPTLYELMEKLGIPRPSAGRD
jgi:two-component system NtrC family response regulator